MATAQTIIDRATEVLRDAEPGHENTTWTKNALMEWVAEGLAQMATLRPDTFTTTRKITLKPGAFQRLPEGVTAIYDIEGTVVVSPDGTETVEEAVTVANHAMVRRFKKKRCLAADAGCGDPGDGYRVKSFSGSTRNQREFRVEPPVPAGAQVEVMATVLEVPTIKNLTDGLPVDNEAALLDWVLHRAFAIETESEMFRAASAQHIAQFYHAMGQAYYAASRAASGYMLGREGTGDPRSGAPRELRPMNIRG